MSLAPAKIINEYFTTKIASEEGKMKVAEYGGTFVRDRLREVSFARMILPPKPVTRADCQRSVSHDTLVKLVELEPRSRAMALTFKDQPTVNIIRAERAEVGFFTVASEMFQKTEQELLAYEMPITRIIEENCVKDMQEIEDREFIIHAESCVQALQKEANGGVVTPLTASALQAGDVVEFSVRKGELARVASDDDAVVRPVQRKDITELRKLLDGNRLKAERLLLTEVDFDDLLSWTIEDQGSQLQTETAIDGWKHNTIMGLPYVRTIKTDILRPGNVYVFTKPDFLGKFFILNSTKFYIDKVANQITFQAWEDIGMILANIAAIRKTELYSGDATTEDDSGILSSVTPVEEDQLGLLNNRVAAGLKYPQLSMY